MLLPPTEGRVPRQAYESHNRQIKINTIQSLRKFAHASEKQVTDRLAQLAMEWDMERTLEMNASLAASFGLLLSILVSRYWLFLSAGVLAFLFQHAIMGYCPPAIWFRAFGWRTAGEIEDEATALRLLHGRVVPSLAKGSEKSSVMLEEFINNKQSIGRFVGEGPNKAVSQAYTKAEE